MELILAGECSHPMMDSEKRLQAEYRRERRIDEALKETFPASDPPSFVGPARRGRSATGRWSRSPILTAFNTDDPDEFTGWCAYWGCAPAELEEAVRDVGVMVANVEAQLTAKGHKRK